MRYSFNGNLKTDKSIDFDVVVIGTGLAGLYTAFNIDPKLSCCIISKENIDISSSWLAQGGIAAAVSADDTPALHLEDTLIAGAGLCDREAVQVLVDEGPKDVRRLVELNVPFDLNDDGELDITLEGGHRKHRIVHAGGDATGRETVKVLARLVAKLENVEFMSHAFLVDVLTDDKGVCGLIVSDTDAHYIRINTRNLVIATGGIGQVYRSSTNPVIATGDGLAAAARAGAKYKNMEFVQFHPTGLYLEGPENRAFLISESVRGEGGLLKNSKGVRFMLGAHELNELAPRDIVARAIYHELEATGETHAYIDITSESEEYLSKRFPTIYSECLKHGINISKDWIPIVPVQHYFVGGIETDLDAQTCVPGLYVCGEAACTGVHGANRLASNSMLECLVFGRRAAQHINASGRFGIPSDYEIPAADIRSSTEFDYAQVRRDIQDLMSDYCFVVRTESGLNYAKTQLENTLQRLEEGFDDCRAYFETLNVASVALAITTGALDRKESVGAHYRKD